MLRIQFEYPKWILHFGTNENVSTSDIRDSLNSNIWQQSIYLFSDILLKETQRENWPSGGHCTGHGAGDGHGSVGAGAPDGPEPSWPPPPRPWPRVTPWGAWDAMQGLYQGQVFEFMQRALFTFWIHPLQARRSSSAVFTNSWNTQGFV